MDQQWFILTRQVAVWAGFGITISIPGSGRSRPSGRGRDCVKTKIDLAVNKFCKIQTLKSRRFEPRLGFLADFA